MRGFCALLACLAVHPVLASAGTVTLKGDGVGVRVEAEDFPASRARDLLKEVGRAYRTIRGRLGVSRESLFAGGSERPLWATWPRRADPRIWIIVREEIRASDLGAEAYFTRMARGELRILLRPPPGEELTPDERHRLWREMTYAILGQTLWRGCPIWLREGLAERFGTIGSEGEHGRLALLKDQLRESVDSLGVESVLSAPDLSTWSRLDGRAVSWAIVHLLEETNREYAQALLYRQRALLEHLVRYPSADAVGQESTEVVRELVRRSKLSAADLRSAVQAWVRADFPEGSALRKTSADDLLRSGRLPGGFGVDIAGRFGLRRHQPGANGTTHTYQDWSGGFATWRFPWSSSMEAWVGVRARRVGGFSAAKNRPLHGLYVPLNTWDASPAGRHRLEKITLDLTAQGIKVGFAWVGVTSPRGLGYLYKANFRLR